MNFVRLIRYGLTRVVPAPASCFRSQASLTPENITDKLTEFAKTTAGLDPDAFERCMTNGLSVGLILKDMGLAEANNVSGTPTVFINGRLAEGAGDAKRLRELIAEARKEVATKAQDSSEPPGVSGNGSPQ